ncbi:MAG: hypothetical protein HYX82_00560 [Chloroflexi bacterium]|nr:hypothetical protein [Chloroflexota bacterium]
MSGHHKRFEFHKVDVNNVDGTAKALESLKPDVILSTLTLQAPRVIQQLLLPVPREIRDKMTPGVSPLGTQLPLNLVLISKLMKAVRQSGIAAHVVNVSFPDAVNPILWAKGMGPTVGAGNDEHLAYEMKRRVSERENVPISEVRIYLVGSYALISFGPKAGVPFFLKVFVRENDVTSKYNAESLIEDALKTRWFQRGIRPQLYSNIGASAAKNVMAILNDTHEFTYTAAPNGLHGSYPTRLSAKGAEIVLPKGLSLEEAASIGRKSLRWYGIEKVKDDGTVVYTDETYSRMKEMLGYECKELGFDEAEQRAKELAALYRRFVERLSKKT